MKPLRALSPPAQHPNLAAIDQLLVTAEHRTTRAFLAHMRNIHPEDRLPARGDFDPLAIPRLLSGLVLVRVEPGPEAAQKRFRILVAGETVLHALSVPMIGRYVDEVAQDLDNGEAIVTVRQRVVDTGCLQYWNGRPRVRFRLDFAGLECCHCPLAADGRSVDHILSFFHYKGISAG